MERTSRVAVSKGPSRAGGGTGVLSVYRSVRLQRLPMSVSRLGQCLYLGGELSLCVHHSLDRQPRVDAGERVGSTVALHQDVTSSWCHAPGRWRAAGALTDSGATLRLAWNVHKRLRAGRVAGVRRPRRVGRAGRSATNVNRRSSASDEGKGSGRFLDRCEFRVRAHDPLAPTRATAATKSVDLAQRVSSGKQFRFPGKPPWRTDGGCL
jgi:hypothetical protein